MKRLGFAIAALAAVATLALGADATGAGAGGTATGAGTTVMASSWRLGRILADGRGRTLYLFEKDRRGSSFCTGTCAAYWPPLLTRGKPTAGPGVRRSLLGVTRRADGSSQVTYAGHPLYRFVQDTRPGQIAGQGAQLFGGGWYVVSPSGKKIEREGDS
jgi:predicted lipoprotein with Yx(FWY)xxD motif